MIATQFFTLAALALSLAVASLSNVAAQSGAEIGNRVTQIGLETVNNAHATSSLATSLQQVLSQYNTEIAGDAFQQIQDAADATAAANIKLNTIMQDFLTSLIDTDDSNPSIFGGGRKLRTEPEQ
ncbi:hypothetical protein PHYBOEH_008309 [Phytophthora boehmeriae]|uniref:RxLR effector protein n=1 Tax=Phytophthora boehmeriae TaxID=109152 RepID=A0A8T1X1S5_9STRA|nr:hypothetical protein PHYBOEH_008309 [Phytophthora boehmeriae]